MTTHFSSFWGYQRPSASARPHYFRPLEDSAADERLLAAILRKDQAAAHHILQAASTGSWIEKFHIASTSENLPALVYERLLDMGLADAMRNCELSSGRKLLDVLKQEAEYAAIFFGGVDQRFVQLADLLGEQVVWIKGSALSRSLYERPQFRSVRDFDLLVRSGQEDSVLQSLQEFGFEPVWDVPGTCARYGVGPVGTLRSMSISPCNKFIQYQNLTLRKSGWPDVELKFDPLDTGLKMKELDRFFVECRRLVWRDRNFLAPSVVDHLILELTHFHKHGFEGWHWLYDIHLLTLKVDSDDGQWQELVRRCCHEGVGASAWAGLMLASDRLGSPVPSDVLRSLAPSQREWAVRFLTYTTTTEFLWNTATLWDMLLSAAFLGDRERKLSALWQTAIPTKEFLAKYYAGGKRLNWWVYPALWLLHCLVLVLPGGLVRKAFGRFLWRYRQEKTGQ